MQTEHENLWFSPAVPWNAVGAWEERKYYLQKSKKLFLRLAWKFQGGSSSVQSACWGQALRMNLKQPRASWDTEDALTAPCCHLNFTALCFADLHFGLKISLVFFYFLVQLTKIILSDFPLLCYFSSTFKQMKSWPYKMDDAQKQKTIDLSCCLSNTAWASVQLITSPMECTAATLIRNKHFNKELQH